MLDMAHAWVYATRNRRTWKVERGNIMIDVLAQFAMWIVIGASIVATIAVWAVVVAR